LLRDPAFPVDWADSSFDSIADVVAPFCTIIARSSAVTAHTAIFRAKGLSVNRGPAKMTRRDICQCCE
jgi:hypothetical protein